MFVVLCSTAGDVLLSSAMKRIGDVSHLRRDHGIATVIKRMASSGRMMLAIGFMAFAFYSLLFALSLADVSLVVPAAASLTFVSNAVASKLFLHANVDRRRWIASVLVCAGVAFLAQ